MNQILLQVLAQDPLKTPAVCLSFRWLLPLIPHLETFTGWFVLPLLGTGLGCFFIDISDLYDQVFSLTGLLYLSTVISMIPKPNTSSKLWVDTNLFTIVCYVVYFAELAVIAYLSLDLEYSVSWLFSITFSTVLTFIFYGMLLTLGFRAPSYFKAIVSIYVMTDIGNILALGVLSPFLTYKIFMSVSIIFLVYLLLPYRHPLIFSGLPVSQSQFDKNLPILRCLFWGVLTVWTDYIALTSFYILEMILASESHQKKDSLLYYCRNLWVTHKSKVWNTIGEMTNTLSSQAEIILALVARKKRFFKAYLDPISTPITFFTIRPSLFSRNL